VSRMAEALDIIIRETAWNMCDVHGNWSREDEYAARLWELWARRPDRLVRLARRYRIKAAFALA